MLERDAMPSMVDAVEAVKNYLRLDGCDDDVLIEGLLATAISQCEASIGRTLIERGMREVIGASAAWVWLTALPVRAITSVRILTLDGVQAALALPTYTIDIDAQGRGRIRFLMPPATARAVVTYSAGASSSWFMLPDTVRQGIVRLVAHHYANRDLGDADVLPANVSALWTAERRVRL
jgi:uncharacterized phiE125 gp8 family phage protein